MRSSFSSRADVECHPLTPDRWPDLTALFGSRYRPGHFCSGTLDVAALLYRCDDWTAKGASKIIAAVAAEGSSDAICSQRLHWHLRHCHRSDTDVL
jgi:hypothetical protein